MLTYADGEEKDAVLSKAALGTVMENESMGRRLLAFCRHAMRTFGAQVRCRVLRMLTCADVC